MTTNRRGITEEDVWVACDQLLLEGDRPTIEKVRHHLGRGSPNTITVHLNTWFAGLGARIADPQGFVQSVVPDPIQAAAEQMWALAVAEAQQVAAAEYKVKQAELNKQREELLEAEEAMRSLKQLWQHEQQQLSMALRHESEGRQALASEVGELKKALATRDAEYTAQHQTLVATRQSLLEQGEQFVAEQKQLIAQFKESEDRLNLELDRARQEAKQQLQQQEQQVKLLKQQRFQAQDALEQALADEQALRAQLRTAEQKHVQAQSLLDQSNAVQGVLRDELTNLRHGLQALQQVKAGAQSAARRLKPSRGRL